MNGRASQLYDLWEKPPLRPLQRGHESPLRPELMIPAERDEIAEILALGVMRVTVSPGGQSGQVQVEIRGRLNALLGDTAFPKQPEAVGSVAGSMGARFIRSRHATLTTVCSRPGRRKAIRRRDLAIGGAAYFGNTNSS